MKVIEKITESIVFKSLVKKVNELIDNNNKQIEYLPHINNAISKSLQAAKDSGVFDGSYIFVGNRVSDDNLFAVVEKAELGDLYLNSDNSNLYRLQDVEGSNKWVFQCTIRGEKGEKGDKGDYGGQLEWKWIVDKPPIEKGSGENSIVVNDEHNLAQSPYSSAKGYGTLAGVRGYYYYDIHDNPNYPEIDGKYVIRLITEQHQAGDSDLSLKNKWSIGDTISLVYNKIYHECSTIIGFFEGNGVLVNNLPFNPSDFNWDTTNIDIEDYSIWVSTRPTSGDVPLGYYAHAEGDSCVALERASHAEGRATKAYGQYAHTEGRGTIAYYCAHAEGFSNEATGFYSHSEGHNTTASGESSHAEGFGTTASGITSHSEGQGTKASGIASHSEGQGTTASGMASHAEGWNTTATEESSHAEGHNTTASGITSHAEGHHTTASGESSHAEGFGTTADGEYSHAEGHSTTADGEYSHSEGYGTTASGESSHSEGQGTQATEESSHAEGSNTTASGKYSHSEGCITTASGESSHAEGYSNEATGFYSHSEGHNTTASGESSHAEGQGTQASGESSHAEGSNTTASGKYSHSEGYSTTASEDSSHAEGRHTTASGMASHAEGQGTFATGNWSHSEGSHTEAKAVGCHSEGYFCEVKEGAKYSHVEGVFTIAEYPGQHVQGRYNTPGNYAHIVGGGESIEAEGRWNIHTLDWDGNAWFAGDVFVGEGDNQHKLMTPPDVETQVYSLAAQSIIGMIETGDYDGESELYSGYTEDNPFELSFPFKPKVLWLISSNSIHHLRSPIIYGRNKFTWMTSSSSPNTLDCEWDEIESGEYVIKIWGESSHHLNKKGTSYTWLILG